MQQYSHVSIFGVADDEVTHHAPWKKRADLSSINRDLVFNALFGGPVVLLEGWPLLHLGEPDPWGRELLTNDKMPFRHLNDLGFAVIGSRLESQWLNVPLLEKDAETYRTKLLENPGARTWVRKNLPGRSYSWVPWPNVELGLALGKHLESILRDDPGHITLGISQAKGALVQEALGTVIADVEGQNPRGAIEQRLSEMVKSGFLARRDLSSVMNNVNHLYHLNHAIGFSFYRNVGTGGVQTLMRPSLLKPYLVSSSREYDKNTPPIKYEFPCDFAEVGGEFLEEFVVRKPRTDGYALKEDFLKAVDSFEIEGGSFRAVQRAFKPYASYIKARLVEDGYADRSRCLSEFVAGIIGNLGVLGAASAAVGGAVVGAYGTAAVGGVVTLAIQVKTTRELLARHVVRCVGRVNRALGRAGYEQEVEILSDRRLVRWASPVKSEFCDQVAGFYQRHDKERSRRSVTFAPDTSELKMPEW